MNKLVFLAGAGLLAVAATSLSFDSPAAAQANQIASATTPAIGAGVGRVPTSWFRRVASLSQPQISPDGNKLMIRMAQNGREVLAWIDLTAASPRPQVIAAMEEYRDAGDRTVGNATWANNDTVLLEYASREILGGARNDITRLVAFNLTTRARTELAWDGAGQFASEIEHIDYENGKILLERGGFRDGSVTGSEIVEVDINTGRFRMVQRNNAVVGDWVTDSRGVVRLGFGGDRDNGRERIMYRSNASENFRTISNAADPTFTGTGLNPLMIDADSDFAIVSDNKSGTGKLYRVNMATLAYSEPLFGVEGYDAGGIATNFDGSKLVGYRVTEQRPRTQFVDPRYAEMQALLEETFGAGNVLIGSSDRAETKFVIRVGAPNQGGAFYIFNTVSGDLTMIGNRWNLVGMTDMNPVSAFRYNASDGVSIEAIMTMPRHRRQTRGLPLVIITHGGPFGVRDNVEYENWSQAMAELGYVVVQPNYRGSGGYGRELVTMGRNNGFGLRMQDDLDDVITHLAAQGTIDPNRVCMMGWSYGGYASARAAQRNPEKYRCAIAGAGVYDLAAMREYDSTYLGRFGANYLAKGAAELNTVSPARNTEGRWAPILIVHGVRDARVPVAQARMLVSRLRGAGKVQGQDYEYIEQPQNTHNLNYDDVHMEWLEGAERWLTRWNPAYIDSDSDRPVAAVPEGVRPARRTD